MTVLFEVSGPFQLRPGIYVSRSMYRFFWLWFAVGWLRVPFHEFVETSYRWSMGGRSGPSPSPRVKK